MSIEIQPKTNLLSSFSQTKINYQQPQFIPAHPPVSTEQPQEKTVLQSQPQKDEFVNSDSKADTQKSNAFKDFAQIELRRTKAQIAHFEAKTAFILDSIDNNAKTLNLPAIKEKLKNVHLAIIASEFAAFKLAGVA